MSSSAHTDDNALMGLSRWGKEGVRGTDSDETCLYPRFWELKSILYPVLIQADRVMDTSARPAADLLRAYIPRSVF
jgi:hypothetical protein